jgi:hypothetical protein
VICLSHEPVEERDDGDGGDESCFRRGEGPHRLPSGSETA